MKAFALLLCFVATAGAEIQSITDLTPEKLVGKWEALTVKDCLAGAPILQMSFTAPDAAYFVATNSKDSSSPPLFLGKLSDFSLAKGQIRLQFTAIPFRGAVIGNSNAVILEHVPPELEGKLTDYEYERVEIEGRATSSGDLADIEGTITIHHRNGKTSKDQVVFGNRLWVHELAEFSKAAEEILHNARVQH